jgi:hypothetical protein
MRPEQKTKSRTKLYQALEGAKELTGAAGTGAQWTILFNAVAAVADTITIGNYVFEFVADGSEDYTKAGTAADPVLVSIGGTPSTTEAATNLVAALHGFAGTSAFGYLHPIDATGASSSTATVTINFFPGTFANAATYITTNDTTTPPTITNVSDGTACPRISPDVNNNIIDTTGYDATNQQYYYLEDGQLGQTAKVSIKTLTTGDTPTILGNLSEAGVAMVECEFITAEPGQVVTFDWTGSVWEMSTYNTLLTVPDFSASS